MNAEQSSNSVSDDNGTAPYSEIIAKCKGIPRPALIALLREMFARGLINTDSIDQPDYLWPTINAHMNDVLPEARIMIGLEGDLMEAASEAYDIGKPAAALILVATVIEHMLNGYHRQFLELKGFDDKEVETILRTTNVESKIGWLLRFGGSFALSEDLQTRIRKTFELRNRIVHFKPKLVTLGEVVSGEVDPRAQLKQLDYLDLLEMVDDLEYELSWWIVGMDPNFQWVIKVFTTYIDNESG